MSRRNQIAIPCALLSAAASLAALLPGAAEARTAPGGFLGVASNTDRPTNEEIERMGDGRVSALRITVNWAEIEPEPPGGGNNPLRFSQLDRVVARAAVNGIRVVPILYGTPKWLTKRSNIAPIRNQRQRRQWRRFIRDLVNRYGNGGSFWGPFLMAHPGSKVRAITHWQVWNEPTVRQFWRGKSKRKQKIPIEYADLLKDTSRAIRGVDADARIITAGIFGTPHAGKGLRSRRFFRALFRVKGIAQHFNSVGVHPYSANWRGVRIQLLWAVREMRRAGIGKKIWITEIGWPTKGRKKDFQSYLSRSQKRQAATMRKTFLRLIKGRNRLAIGKVLWFTFRDESNLGKEFARCNLCKYAGMFTEDFRPKRSWKVFTGYTGARSARPATARAG